MYVLYDKLKVLVGKRMEFIYTLEYHGGRGQWTINYTGAQSSINHWFQNSGLFDQILIVWFEPIILNYRRGYFGDVY